MAPSRAASVLGRQLWTSIRQPPGGAVWRIPIRQQPQVRGNAPFQPPPPLPCRPLHSTRSSRSSSTSSGSSIRRSGTTGGLLLLGLSSPETTAPTVIASCAAAEAALATSSHKSNLGRLAWQAWTRNMHTEGRGRARVLGRRSNSSKAGDTEGKTAASQGKQDVPKPPEPPQAGDPASHESIAGSMSGYLRSHLPKMPHRPTREELLAATTGFWERLKIRFKWFSIRSMRPWNADEWGAFVSWFLFGHLVWILVGTTTFFSLVILTVNTVFAQGRSRDHPS